MKKIILSKKNFIKLNFQTYPEPAAGLIKCNVDASILAQGNAMEVGFVM